jgi:hypothetical protein
LQLVGRTLGEEAIIAITEVDAAHKKLHAEGMLKAPIYNKAVFVLQVTVQIPSYATRSQPVGPVRPSEFG